MGMSVRRGMSLSSFGPYIYNPSTFLVGKKGAYFDPADATRLWQDSAATTPATGATDPVGAYDGNRPDTTVLRYTQSDNAARPTRASNRLAITGSQFMSANAEMLDLFNAAPAAYLGFKFNAASLTATRPLATWSTTTAGNALLGVVLLNTGAVQVYYRRAAGDTVATENSAAGVVTTGTDYVLRVSLDWLNGGAGALRVMLGATQIISATVAGSGVTDAAASARARLGANLTGVPPTQSFSGSLSRFVGINALPTGADDAAIYAWLQAGT